MYLLRESLALPVVIVTVTSSSISVDYGHTHLAGPRRACRSLSPIVRRYDTRPTQLIPVPGMPRATTRTAANDRRRGPTARRSYDRGRKHAPIGRQSSYLGRTFDGGRRQYHPLPPCAPVQLTGLYYPVPSSRAIPIVVCCFSSFSSLVFVLTYD